MSKNDLEYLQSGMKSQFKQNKIVLENLIYALLKSDKRFFWICSKWEMLNFLYGCIKKQTQNSYKIDVVEDEDEKS